MTTVPRTCSVVDCGRKNYAGSMCQTHYKRLKSEESLEAPVRAYGQIAACSVEGCSKPYSCKGFCNVHYQRMRKGRPLHDPIRRRGLLNSCTVEGCDNPHRSRGLCGLHYQRITRGVTVDTLVAPRDEQRGCDAPECSKPHYAKGYCSIHYQQLKRGSFTGRSRPVVCSAEGCDRPYRANGYCAQCNRVWKLYKLDPSKWLPLRDAGCMICGTTDGVMVVDHDHSCCPGAKTCGNCVRGALCSDCNLGLGVFRDDVDKLRKAIEYLTATNDVVLLAM